MQMYFTNSFGRVNFSFRGTGSIRVTECSGISNPSMRISSSFYAETGKTAVLSRHAEPRNITVGGDILCGNRELSKISSVLSCGGNLYLIFKGKMRKIYCDECRFEVGRRYGMYIRYSLVFTCYDPYFTDLTPTRVTVHSRRDLIYPEFTLPCVFTESVTQKNAVNLGDVPVMPVFTVHSLSGGSSRICIKNNTTSGFAEFDYNFTPGEVLTVDTEKRKVFSSVSGDAINSLAHGSYLSSLALIRGANLLEFTAADTSADFNCFCSFYSKYCEGEY